MTDFLTAAAEGRYGKVELRDEAHLALPAHVFEWVRFVAEFDKESSDDGRVWLAVSPLFEPGVDLTDEEDTGAPYYVLTIFDKPVSVQRQQ